MFPLRDENPTDLVPFITVALIAVNVAVWVLVQDAGHGRSFIESLCAYGAIPGEITGRIPAGTWVRLGRFRCEAGGLTVQAMLTSMFLHGSWMHLIGNMWFLWVFGNNIEDSMGHLRFLVFYLLAGVLAAGAHVWSAPASGVPTVGASGAISAVMGAYLILYPRVRVYTLVFIVIFVRILPLPAWLILGEWFLLQLLYGTASAGVGGGVAFWAHVGGFLSGVVLIKLFENRSLVAARLPGR